MSFNPRHFLFARTTKMLSVLTLVSLALFAQSITCLPSAISSDAEVPENFNLEPNGLSPFTTETGMLSSDLKAPSVDGSDAFLSNQLAFNEDFTASAPPASQPNACGEAQKRKRQTEGDTACPAELREKEPGAALETPKPTPQDQQSNPEKPGAPGSRKKIPSWLEQSIHTRHRGVIKTENFDSSCPKRYPFTVCGIHDTDHLWTWEDLNSVHDADLCMSSLFYIAFLTLESLALTACTRDRGCFGALWPGPKKRVVLQRIQRIRKSNAFRPLLTLS